MSSEEIKAGHWYLCVRCRSCNMEIPLMEFLPDVDVESASLVQIQCYYCGARHDYRLREVGCLQARAWEVAST